MLSPVSPQVCIVPFACPYRFPLEMSSAVCVQELVVVFQVQEKQNVEKLCMQPHAAFFAPRLFE